MAKKILLVDDERNIETLVRRIVEDAGHVFSYAPDGIEALSLIHKEKPDLAIIDVMMPKMDGFTTCRNMRAAGILIPVIFLSAKGDIVDKSVGFGMGGDDYMTKPFDPQELMLHVEAQLRRAGMMSAPKQAPEDRSVGRLQINAAQHKVALDGRPVKLTPKEFQILATLASSPGDVFTKEQLIEAAWGREYLGETGSITVFIRKMRQKMESDPSDPRILETVWGIGYRLNPDELT